jgi:hypothetical protein
MPTDEKPRSAQGNPMAGIVVDRLANDSCNLAVIPLPAYVICSYQSKNFLHVEDVFLPDPAQTTK